MPTSKVDNESQTGEMEILRASAVLWLHKVIVPRLFANWHFHIIVQVITEREVKQGILFFCHVVVMQTTVHPIICSSTTSALQKAQQDDITAGIFDSV